MKTEEALTDEALVLQICKTRDTFLFGILYDRYEKVVYNKCFGFVGNIDEAKDLTQDVFFAGVCQTFHF